MNEVIERAFNGFRVPVNFVYYDGKETTYIIYQLAWTESRLSCDDELRWYVDYYDFDIYSKSDYTELVIDVRKIMKKEGFTWLPGKSSGDMYEPDTGFFHKTLCFTCLRYAQENMEEEEQQENEGQENNENPNE